MWQPPSPPQQLEKGWYNSPPFVYIKTEDELQVLEESIATNEFMVDRATRDLNCVLGRDIALQRIPVYKQTLLRLYRSLVEVKREIQQHLILLITGSASYSIADSWIDTTARRRAQIRKF